MTSKCNEYDGSNNRDYSCVNSKNDRHLIDETRDDFCYNVKQAPDDTGYYYAIRSVSFSQYDKSGHYMKIICPMYKNDSHIARK